MKVFYSFANDRRPLIEDSSSGDSPRTGLFGFDYLGAYGLEAVYRYPLANVPRWVSRIVGYHCRQLLTYPMTRGCDVVFGSTLLSMVPAKKIMRTKSKFVFFNISASRMLATQRGFSKSIAHAALMEMDAIVCLANSQKDFILKHTAYSAERIHVVRLGVDTDFHRFVGQESRSDTILSVGRDNGRDYQTVVDVARQLPERSFEIVCSKRNLENISSIPDNITVLYDVAPKRLREMYQTAGLLLLVTHDDSFDDGSDCSGQTVLLDAMASGLPVVATHKSALADYVEPEKEALIVPSYDVEACVEAIYKVDSEDFRSGMAQNARKRVDQDFTMEKMTEQLAGIFLNVT